MHILFIWRKHYLYAPFEAARDFLASSRWLSVTFYWGVSGFISRLFLIRHVLILKILWINFWNGKQTSVLSAIKWLVKTNIAFDRLCHQIELITSWLLHTVCALLLELYCTFQTCELSMLLARKSAESKWKQDCGFTQVCEFTIQYQSSLRFFYGPCQHFWEIHIYF